MPWLWDNKGQVMFCSTGHDRHAAYKCRRRSPSRKLFKPQSPHQHHQEQPKTAFRYLQFSGNMFLNLLLATAGIGLTRTASAVICHVKSEIYHRQLSACGSFSCIPGNTL